METTTKRQQLAEQLYDAFTSLKLDKPNEYGDESRWILRDGSPQWMTDAIHAAHADYMPDDWIYCVCMYAAEHLKDANDWDDTGEFADSMVDPYNHERARWLAANLGNGDMVDEAVSEFGWNKDDGIYGAIGMGQYQLAGQVLSLLAQAIEKQAEEQDDESND